MDQENWVWLIQEEENFNGSHNNQKCAWTAPPPDGYITVSKPEMVAQLDEWLPFVDLVFSDEGELLEITKGYDKSPPVEEQVAETVSDEAPVKASLFSRMFKRKETP